MFWDGFVEMVRLARDLIRADREGDWDLHLKTVEAVLPYFASFDSNNPLTSNPYCTESLPCDEGLGVAAAERNK